MRPDMADTDPNLEWWTERLRPNPRGRFHPQSASTIAGDSLVAGEEGSWTAIAGVTSESLSAAFRFRS